jgi:hypothetical protein
MTKAEFKRKAERAFQKANPTAIIVGWIDAKQVTFPTGIREYVGHFDAVAPGHKRRVLLATGSDSYVMVR